MNPDNLDLDPPPRRSPRLFARVEDIPHSCPTSSLFRHKLTRSQIERLRRDLAIYAAVQSGMSQRMASKVFGMSVSGLIYAYRRISIRKSRV